MARNVATRRIPAYFLYGEAPRAASDPLLHAETIEARSSRHQWKIEPHTHQSLHQIIFVSKGRGVTLLDGVRTQYRPPVMILVPAGSVHGFEFEPGTTGHVVSLSDQALRDSVQVAASVGPVLARPQVIELQDGAPHAADLSLAVEMLVRELGANGTGHQMALNGWLHVLIGNAQRIVQGSVVADEPDVGHERALLERFLALVECRYRSGQKVKDYAAGLHVPPSRLRRVCVTLTGQSPMQLVHARILLEAKRLLHYTDNAVLTVAIELGFDDAAYFTRFFTRRVGVSPRAFRRRGPEEGFLREMQ